MSFTAILFYLFSTILVFSSLIVVSTRNMVHAAMFLILAFFNAAGLFILLGGEFLAMLLIVVYVGAIAVLFLFVIMMLDIDRAILKQRISRYIPVLICVAAIIFCEISLVLKLSPIEQFQKISMLAIHADDNNIKSIGNVLYTDFFLPFQLSGVVLFIAMIGAIVLTLKDDNRFIRKQKVFFQTSRNKENSLEIVKIQPKKGIDLC